MLTTVHKYFLSTILVMLLAWNFASAFQVHSLYFPVNNFTCQVERVMCHVSCVTYHSFLLFYKVVDGGPVINGATPSSFFCFFVLIYWRTHLHTLAYSCILLHTFASCHMSLAIALVLPFRSPK